MTNDSALRGEEFRVRLKSPLAADVLRRLQRLSGPRATLSVLHTLGCTTGLVTIAVLWPRWWLAPFLILAIAGQQHAFAILAHQSAHYRLYETRWLNDLVGRVFAIPLGVSMVTYRVIHRTHHNNLYTPIDPDLAQMAGYPRGRAYLARKLLKDLVGITTIKNYSYFMGRSRRSKTSSDRVEAAPLDDTSAAMRAASRRDLRTVVLLNALALPLLVWAGAWRWYLIYWFLPLVTVLQLLLRLRAVLEHGAVSDTRDPLRAARTTICPGWIRWLVYPHNMNFHVEHHLYPAIPHYRLADAHSELVKVGVAARAEMVPTLRASLAKIFAEPRIVGET